MKNTITSGGEPTAQLSFIIEDQKFEWPHQYITGVELKQLIGASLSSELYLAVKEPWDDEPIGNDTRVNLARPDIECFFLKKALKFTINEQLFDWHKQYIYGKQLRKLGGIDEDDDIYLSVPRPHKDELIADDTKVNLARPTIEHFYSKEKDKQVAIIVNGKEKLWDKRLIAFDEVVKLAFGHYEDKPTTTYTVTYKRGSHQNPEGSMVKGDVVHVKHKMIFNVTSTDRS